MKKQTVLVVGNEYVPQDSTGCELIEQIKKDLPTFTFVRWDPTEELPQQSDELILVDVVLGIQSLQVFDSLEQFRLSPRNTAHDFDLPLALGLLVKLKKISKLTIIGLPMGDTSQILKKHLIKTLTTI